MIEFAFKFDVFRRVRNEDKSLSFEQIRKNKFTKIEVDQLVFRVTFFEVKMWESLLARHKTSLKTVIEARRHESRGEKAGKTEQTRHQERFLVSIRRVIRFERRRLLFTGTRVNSPRILIHEKFQLPIYLLGSLLILIQAGDYLKRRGDRKR